MDRGPFGQMEASRELGGDLIWLIRAYRQICAELGFKHLRNLASDHSVIGLRHRVGQVKLTDARDSREGVLKILGPADRIGENDVLKAWQDQGLRCATPIEAGILQVTHGTETREIPYV